MTLKPANIKDNSRRRFAGGGPRPDNNEIKREEAKQRQEAWDKLYPKDKLEALDRRLGKGVGAKKQRARIQAQIDRKTDPKAFTPEAKNKSIEKERAKDRRERERKDRPGK